jgi:hypothetical protein
VRPEWLGDDQARGEEYLKNYDNRMGGMLWCTLRRQERIKGVGYRFIQ